MSSDDKDSKDPVAKKVDLREIVTPKKPDHPLVEKGSRGVTVDDIDYDNPPIKMQPKNKDESKPAGPPNETKDTKSETG